MSLKHYFISVIIPNYNYSHYLNETVQSVLSQNYSDLECIIVDDGSTDNSREVILELEKKDKRVRSVFKKNGGLSSARNAGIKVAKGDYIAFLDADDLWKPEKLQNQIVCLQKNKDSNFVFSNYTGFYPDGRKEDFKHEFGNPDFFDFIRQNPVAGSASSVLIAKTIINKTGYFDESLKSTEDHDYWFRCLLQGAKMKFCNHHDVLIRLHESSMSKNLQRMNFYNYTVLKKQTETFPEIEKKKDLATFNRLVREKLQSLLWIARDTKDKKLTSKIYRLALNALSIKEGTSFIKSNLIYDLKLFSKQLYSNN